MEHHYGGEGGGDSLSAHVVNAVFSASNTLRVACLCPLLPADDVVAMSVKDVSLFDEC